MFQLSFQNKIKSIIHILIVSVVLFVCTSCNKEQLSDEVTDYHFSKNQVGVCSWSWKSDMTTILGEMEKMEITGMQLATTPWVAGDLSDSQKEIFGYEESSEVLDYIRSLSKSGKLNIMSAMICFPHEDYTTLETIWNTSGFMFTEDAAGHSAEQEWATNSDLVRKAAELTSSLGVPYLSTEVGFINKNWDLALERVKFACDVCIAEGVTFLIESGQESGEEMKSFITDLKNRYPGTEIGINFDPANHILYGTDTPNHAFDIMLPWIKQVHVKDAVLDESKRAAWSEDVVWGSGDVSRTYDFLQHVYNSGYKGNLLVEHEWGEDRISDIEVAIDAILCDTDF